MQGTLSCLTRYLAFTGLQYLVIKLNQTCFLSPKIYLSSQMGNLTQNLKTRFSGLVESVKSWRTARGKSSYYVYMVLYIQNIDAKQIEIILIKMLFFRHWRLWRSGVSDNRGNLIFSALQFWKFMLAVVTNSNVPKCQLVYGIWSRKWERDSKHFCIEISFSFSGFKIMIQITPKYVPK